MRALLKSLAPYLAVAVGWLWLSNAWLAILAYHLQILAWARFRISLPRRPSELRCLLPALPAIAAGPVLYALLPAFSHGHLPQWLAGHGLSRAGMLLMLPYFGIAHPWMEQLHWHPLRERSMMAHPLFAGYHVMVLASLTTWRWLVLVFAVLTLASYLWARLTASCRSLTPAYVAHALADIGVVAVAWLRM